MKRFGTAVSRVGLVLMLACLSPALAAEAGKPPEAAPCGCTQKAEQARPDQKPERAGECICRLVKCAQFGTSCAFYAMVCPPPPATPSYGCWTDTCQSPACYRGCTVGSPCPTTPCPGAGNNCKTLARADKASATYANYDYMVDPIVANTGEPIDETWQPAQLNNADVRVTHRGPPLVALLRFPKDPALRVKLWPLTVTPKRTLPDGTKPPPKPCGFGRQQPGHVPYTEEIAADKIEYLPPGTQATAAVVVTASNGERYFVRLKDLVHP